MPSSVLILFIPFLRVLHNSERCILSELFSIILCVFFCNRLFVSSGLRVRVFALTRPTIYWAVAISISASHPLWFCVAYLLRRACSNLPSLRSRYSRLTLLLFYVTRLSLFANLCLCPLMTFFRIFNDV